MTLKAVASKQCTTVAQIKIKMPYTNLIQTKASIESNAEQKIKPHNQSSSQVLKKRQEAHSEGECRANEILEGFLILLLNLFTLLRILSNNHYKFQSEMIRLQNLIEDSNILIKISY